VARIAGDQGSVEKVLSGADRYVEMTVPSEHGPGIERTRSGAWRIAALVALASVLVTLAWRVLRRSRITS
jgi:hypothetical protein